MADNWALYSAIDAAVTLQCMEEMERTEPNFAKLRPWYELECRLLEPATFMMVDGLLVDHARMEKRKVEMEARRDAVLAELHAEVGKPLNPGSPKQCADYFYGMLGKKARYGKGGGLTTDDKAMAQLARDGLRAAKLVQQWRGLNKLITSYFEITLDDDGRLRCSINIAGTISSRLSTSKTIFGTGANMQNQHMEYKHFIVPDAGHVFIEMDKSKSEWVITANVANDPAMLAAIASGDDVHAITGARITGVPLEIVKVEEEIIGKTTDEDTIKSLRDKYIPQLPQIAQFLPRAMTIRQAGKKTNHACNYIMGYHEFSIQNETPIAEARMMVDGYRAAYCGLPQWWSRVPIQLAKHKCVENCFGRPFYLYDELSDELVKSAVSIIPQSSNVEMLNRAMVSIYDERSDYMLPLKMSMQVHDSLLMQYPIDRWRDMALAIISCKYHMEPTLTYENRSFTVDTDLAVGITNWADATKDNPWGMNKIKMSTDPEVLAKRLEEHYLKYMASVQNLNTTNAELVSG